MRKFETVIKLLQKTKLTQAEYDEAVKNICNLEKNHRLTDINYYSRHLSGLMTWYFTEQGDEYWRKLNFKTKTERR